MGFVSQQDLIGFKALEGEAELVCEASRLPRDHGVDAPREQQGQHWGKTGSQRQRGECGAPLG